MLKTGLYHRLSAIRSAAENRFAAYTQREEIGLSLTSLLTPSEKRFSVAPGMTGSNQTINH